MSDLIANFKNIPTRENLIDLLGNSALIITFKKLDGDERIMTCTRSLELIPEDRRPKNGIESTKENISVWDLNAQGWRSFLYDRVIKVDFIN